MPTENRANKKYSPARLCNPGVCCETAGKAALEATKKDGGSHSSV